MSVTYTYAIAVDLDPDDPNPHAWDVDSRRFPSETAAEQAVEARAEELTGEGYGEDEIPPWQIVRLAEGS